jgi:hypothetical protein
MLVNSAKLERKKNILANLCRQAGVPFIGIDSDSFAEISLRTAKLTRQLGADALRAAENEAQDKFLARREAKSAAAASAPTLKVVGTVPTSAAEIAQLQARIRNLESAQAAAPKAPEPISTHKLLDVAQAAFGDAFVESVVRDAKGDGAAIRSVLARNFSMSGLRVPGLDTSALAADGFGPTNIHGRGRIIRADQQAKIDKCFNR